MTEEDDMDDEAETSTTVRSRFAKFESPDDIDTDESADNNINNDDALSDDETTADPDSSSDFASDTDTDTDTTTPDPEEHITNDSRSTRVWSDAAITDATDTDSDSIKTGLSSDDRLKNSDDMSDSAVSTGSSQHSTEPAADRSQRDSERIWNQPSGSDSSNEASTSSNQNKNSSVNIGQTDIPEEIITDSNQNENTSVNTGQTDSPVAPQSQSQSQQSQSQQSQSQQSSSLTDSTSAESIQSDSSTVSDGSQALLLGEDNSQTWNAGFNHILETQYPQNLLLLVPAGETIDILRACQEHPSWDGGEIIIIKVGASVPGDMSVAELSGDGMDESIETHQISDQTDLSRLGILITQVLDNWQNPDQNTVCSVHTLQAFLQYLSPQKVFQFLYTLSRRLQSADIETTYLMTPSDGDRTINTLRPIFDTVIET